MRGGPGPGTSETGGAAVRGDNRQTTRAQQQDQPGAHGRGGDKRTGPARKTNDSTPRAGRRRAPRHRAMYENDMILF